jgi:flagellar biosynthesis protein FlhF
MHIRTFRAPSMQQALAQIRREMGPDASVLHTRAVKSGWWWAGRSQVEVTAGLRAGLPKHSSASDDPSSQPVVHEPVRVPSENERQWQEQFERLARQVEDLRQSNAHGLTASAAWPHAIRLTRERLLARGFPAGILDRALQKIQQDADGNELRDRADICSALRDYVAETVRSAPPIRPTPGRQQQIALVGPTGVGKTTTIAKLAAGLRLNGGCRVGLVTVDTFRIAAVEQLRAYADIMDLPMEVVERPDEMRGALARLESADVVLIDTVGRSPLEQPLVEQLQATLGSLALDELHLVISATSSAPALAATLESFAALEPTRLLLTKIDEVTSLAPLASAICDSNLPIAYITTGQRVPDDIRIANGDWLVDWLVAEAPLDLFHGVAA